MKKIIDIKGKTKEIQITQKIFCSWNCKGYDSPELEHFHNFGCNIFKETLDERIDKDYKIRPLRCKQCLKATGDL